MRRMTMTWMMSPTRRKVCSCPRKEPPRTSTLMSSAGELHQVSHARDSQGMVRLLRLKKQLLA